MRRLGLVRALGLALPLVLSLSVVAAPPASSQPSDMPEMPVQCRSAYKTATQWKSDTSRVASDRVVRMDGHEVILNRRGWAAEDPRDPSWTLWFHSLAWLVPLALDDSETAIQVFEERDRALPDPGRIGDNEGVRASGWTQGQFRTRLETATCLFELTGDERLKPIAVRLAEANMDADRYPGPPNFRVHNHGAMSNVALMQAGKAFDVREWIDFALSRFERDMPEVFEPCGMMFEQASGYQLHNVRLYAKAAERLGETLEQPQRALGALVRPDGVLEAIGDGQPSLDAAPNGESLWCARTGWAAATVDEMHFTLRFGPRMQFHGHRDHGSMTWFTYGIPVLSDRGHYDKERGDRFEFAHSMAAHSVFEPLGVPQLNPETTAQRLSDTSFRLRDTDEGVTRQRTVTFSRARLTVRDEGTGAKEWIQHFQLAPGWKPTDTGAIHKSGATLTISCPRWKAVKVESFTAWRTAVSAWDLQCRVEAKKGKTAQVATTLAVTPPVDG
ncbi:MAG: hypothetical protein KGN38_02455 [Actinomycetales bacterium]|nr:hypothetical protein [Actinomycetales bacterium]